MSSRSYNRRPEEPRPISFELGFTVNADGSVLTCFGQTKVICTAFLEDRVPPFLRNQKRGWVTAEYGMLPGSTHSRSAREAARGKQSGRTVEIARLIGRCLRGCVEMTRLGERTVIVDCDVIQADGGTRTASISGGCVALIACLWKHRELFEEVPVIGRAAAISLGVVEGELLTDLDYAEDSSADVDLNLVFDHADRLLEIQGTGEQTPFSMDQLHRLLKMGQATASDISGKQLQALRDYGVDSAWLL